MLQNIYTVLLYIYAKAAVTSTLYRHYCSLIGVALLRQTENLFWVPERNPSCIWAYCSSLPC